jgi:predicted phage baseplate assembly protein
MAPPQGRGNVRATRYETGGGDAGNRPEGTITQLKTAVPSVAAVVNVAAAMGGADAEPLEAVRDRGPRLLRHGDRAVTVGDVEDLARDASPAVARVLGVAATSSSDAGIVGVVVVPASDARQPLPSVELLERVRIHVEQRLPLSAELWVAGPGWARIDVTAEVVAVSPEQAGDVSIAIHETLERFLHPLTGGPQGGSWAFGRTPRRSDVLAMIEEIAGVDHVRGLTVATTQTRPEPAPGATLVYSGDHRIAMASSTDDATG